MYKLEKLMELLFEENRLHLHDKIYFRKQIMIKRDKLADKTQTFFETLNDEQKLFFGELEDLNTDMRYKEYELYFTEGVKFGLSVGAQSVEIFDNSNLNDRTRELLQDLRKPSRSQN